MLEPEKFVGRVTLEATFAVFMELVRYQIWTKIIHCLTFYPIKWFVTSGVRKFAIFSSKIFTFQVLSLAAQASSWLVEFQPRLPATLLQLLAASVVASTPSIASWKVVASSGSSFLDYSLSVSSVDFSTWPRSSALQNNTQHRAWLFLTYLYSW